MTGKEGGKYPVLYSVPYLYNVAVDDYKLEMEMPTSAIGLISTELTLTIQSSPL